MDELKDSSVAATKITTTRKLNRPYILCAGGAMGAMMRVLKMARASQTTNQSESNWGTSYIYCLPVPALLPINQSLR